MRIAEIYSSRQGEGRLTGASSVFVRTSGCNLRCSFCDTPFTSWNPEGDDLSVEAVLERVLQLPDAHVVITGGEPMLFSELIPLTARLRAAGRHITIETAGTLYLPVECDLMSISPKLANSTPSAEAAGPWRARHEASRHRPDVIARLISEYDYQLKFVVASPADCAQVKAWLADLPEIPSARVLLMPQGIEPKALAQIGRWLEPYCHEHGYVFCPRKHIDWYGHARGT